MFDSSLDIKSSPRVCKFRKIENRIHWNGTLGKIPLITWLSLENILAFLFFCLYRDLFWEDRPTWCTVVKIMFPKLYLKKKKNYRFVTSRVKTEANNISQTWNEYDGLWDKTVMLVQNMKRMHLRPSVNFLKAVLSSAVKLIIKIGQQITVAKF